MAYSGAWLIKTSQQAPTSAIGNVPDPAHHEADQSGPANPYWQAQTITDSMPAEVLAQDNWAVDRAPGGPTQVGGSVGGGMSDPTQAPRPWQRGSWRHQLDPGTVLARQWVATTRRDGQISTLLEPQDGGATVDSMGTLELQRHDQLPRRIGKRQRRSFNGPWETHNWDDARNPHLPTTPRRRRTRRRSPTARTRRPHRGCTTPTTSTSWPPRCARSPPTGRSPTPRSARCRRRVTTPGGCDGRTRRRHQASGGG